MRASVHKALAPPILVNDPSTPLCRGKPQYLEIEHASQQRRGSGPIAH